MRIYLGMILPFFLLACGGGSDGGGSPEEKSGVFIDSPVQGLNFECGDISGITDAKGTFKYTDNCSVVFSVGDIEIGAAAGAPVLTPVELVPGASDENDEQVTNIVRFLLTMDANNDPGDGILIPVDVSNAAQGKSIDFALPANQFSFDTNVSSVIAELTIAKGDSRSLVSENQARNHFNSSLLSLYVGVYNGTYSGDDSGSWTFLVDSTGTITGTANSNIFNESFFISGSVSSDGQSQVSGSAGDSIFTGSFTRTGIINGSWENISEGESGNFTGSKEQESQDDSNQSSRVSRMNITGVDVGNIGTEFKADDKGDALQIIQTTQVTWRTDLGIDDNKGTRIAQITAQLMNDGLQSMSLIYSYSLSTDELYSYSASCFSTNVDCSGITIDEDNKKLSGTIILNRLATGENNAQGSVTLNGELYW